MNGRKITGKFVTYQFLCRKTIVFEKSITELRNIKEKMR